VLGRRQVLRDVAGTSLTGFVSRQEVPGRKVLPNLMAKACALSTSFRRWFMPSVSAGDRRLAVGVADTGSNVFRHDGHYHFCRMAPLELRPLDRAIGSETRIERVHRLARPCFGCRFEQSETEESSGVELADGENLAKTLLEFNFRRSPEGEKTLLHDQRNPIFRMFSRGAIAQIERNGHSLPFNLNV
jgi:hypothetical protein